MAEKDIDSDGNKNLEGDKVQEKKPEVPVLVVNERFASVLYKDAIKISYFLLENQAPLEELMKVPGSYKTVLESGDIMELGPVGLVLFESDGIPNNPSLNHYVTAEELDKDDYQEEPGEYELGVVDLSKFEIKDLTDEKVQNDEEGRIVCIVKENKYNRMVLVRIPIEQVAKVSPLVPEDKDGAVEITIKVRELTEKLKSDEIASVRERNEMLLERGRLISGAWIYWGESTDAVDIPELLPEVYEDLGIGKSIQEISMYVEGVGTWDDDAYESNLWKAKTVIGLMEKYIHNQSGKNEEINFEDIANNLETISQEIVTTPEVFWKMVKPVVGEMVVRGEPMGAIRDLLERLSALMRIDEIEEVAGYLAREDI